MKEHKIMYNTVTYTVVVLDTLAIDKHETKLRINIIILYSIVINISNY